MERAVENAPDGGWVVFVRFDPAIINGQFLKIAQDAQRQFGRPAITAQLVRGADVLLDVNGRFLGFEKKFARAANAKTVIRGFCRAAHADGIFMNDVLVGFGVALLVVNVPAQRLEKRIKEFAAQLGFVVLAGFVSVELLFEAGDQIQNFPGRGHE